MPTLYLIDGYNVVHHCAKLQRLAQAGFETARDTLVDNVARYCSITGNRARIVFDGRGRRAEANLPGYAGGAVEVVYSPEKHSADTIIERMVYNAEQDIKSIVVVSGDRGIRELCRAMGSLVMAAGNFLQMVEERLQRSSSELAASSNAKTRMPLADRLGGNARESLQALRDRLDNPKD